MCVFECVHKVPESPAVAKVYRGTGHDAYTHPPLPVCPSGSAGDRPCVCASLHRLGGLKSLTDRPQLQRRQNHHTPLPRSTSCLSRPNYYIPPIAPLTPPPTAHRSIYICAQTEQRERRLITRIQHFPSFLNPDYSGYNLIKTQDGGAERGGGLQLPHTAPASR